MSAGAFLVAWVESADPRDTDHWHAYRYADDTERLAALADAAAHYEYVRHLNTTSTASVAEVLPHLSTDYF